ncbi:hypothetical protein O7600_23090 [Micromonospora sp. WMMA1998]|nr:hypothetical protein [Micromonospora sp. WMMA1998]WBC18183.1 hypothetical protein O7600_23090 [Micromonospora sp. WMMA1998]
MDVSSMWACLQDQDTTGQWKQVAGWRKVCDLALAHLSRLREYRRGLAEAWPPETNAAARAYVAELDQLIDRVQHTHDAAAANYDALAAAARAIGSARTELRPLYDEYATKLRQKQAYETTVADPKAVAGSRLPERPPVTDDDLERLNVRARGLMTGLSGELQQAQVMLQRPPAPARPGPRVDQHPSDPYVDAVPAPIIPPVVAVPVTPSVQATTGRPAPSGSPTARPAGSPSVPAIGNGPVLGGAAPSSAIQPPPAGPTPPAALQNSQAGGVNLPLPPSAPTRGFGGSQAGPDRALPKGVGQQPPTRATLPNGLIGNPPAISQPGGGSSPRRVNPLGGVIGGGGAGTAPSGAAGSRPGSGRGPHLGPHGGTPLGGAPSFPAGYGRQAAKGLDESSEQHWDPDDPWKVNRGVDPVLGPPEEGPIDPGPAIGFDR